MKSHAPRQNDQWSDEFYFWVLSISIEAETKKEGEQF